MAEGRTFYSNNTQKVDPVVEEPQLTKIAEGEQTAETVLESSIRSARLQLIKYLEASKDVYINQSQNYFDTERKVTSTLTSLHDKRESLLPNGLYVLTGGILGSIITRRSNIAARLVAPLIFGVASFKLFMPLTFERTFNFASEVEKSQLPDVYAKQTALINKADELVKQTNEAAESQQKSINSFLESSKKTIADWTGLQIDQIVTEKKK